MPDDVAGELPVAIIQTLERDPPSVDQMRELVEVSLGPQNSPVAYFTLQDLGIDAFPTTTSGKVRKDKLKAIVIEHFLAKANTKTAEAETAQPMLNGNEKLLVQALAEVSDQPAETVSLDTPLATLTDSINALRFQAHIKKLTSKNITMEDVLHATSIRALAQRLERLPILDQSNSSTIFRKGSPTTAEMVHTHGENSQALRTRLVTEPLLARLCMSWSDVEDVFPIPDFSARSFEARSTKAYSIRMSFITRSVDRSRLREALEVTMQQWPVFRALAVRLDQQALFVTVRAGNRWSEAAVTEVSDLENPEDLCSLMLPEAKKNNIQPHNGGLLTRFFIANIKSTGAAGLIIRAHHSPHDAVSLQAFIKDLQHNLAGSLTIEPRTSYKIFADMYYQYSNSLPSQIAAAFHVTRLRGISSLRETCWPRQRCVGWHIGDDEGYTVPTGVDATLLSQRKQIDDDSGYAGLMGIERYARLNDLGELRFKHKVSAPVLFKAACALLNSHLTLSREVLFANTQAGRQWPFLDPSIAQHLPNPVTIAGNTLASVLNRIQIHPHETTGSFLARLEEEQKLFTAHAHVPFDSITSQLNPDDAATFLAGKR